ncbi:hypothetical protein Tsubulata_012994 [Turnera subulata]|uniref:Uncharacterized protein n=1 Tax=Turnera subulata TaxID=218843 RepID=A0A9Q0J4A7_9ROSI|nr:hypothetical protein Tsubulata_012994 [Turnera subulata]
MEWSATSATDAYLDTLKLRCNDKWRCDSRVTREPGSNEFLSALAAGTKAKLIVEVTSGVSPSTAALAAAARRTGGRLICILPEPNLAESKQVIKDLGLKDMVEFKTDDPYKVLPNYEKIDFSLVDCMNEEHTRLLKLLDVNPRRSVVVANNLVGENKGLGGQVRGMEDKAVVRSMKHLIGKGKGMEVTMIEESNDFVDKKDQCPQPQMLRCDVNRKNHCSSKWVVKVDEESGEEHIYRVCD